MSLVQSKSVLTSEGFISFQQLSNGKFNVAMRGQPTLVVEEDAKSVGWWTVRRIKDGPNDLRPFVLEKTPAEAYAAALREFWNLPGDNAPAIKGKRIVFADHAVVMRAGKSWSKDFIAEYLREMADSLEPNGTMAQHRRELRDMNNDGTWAVVAH